jgi:hypothetical protein
LFGPARDQGPRPTCLAFATSDAHAGLRPGWQPLSCEYAFFQAQHRTGRSAAEGATLTSMLDGLQQDGQPEEAGWPYLPATPADLTAWQPPNSVGARYRRASARGDTTVAPILAKLDQRRPVLLMTLLSRSFYLPSTEGVVDPANDEAPEPTQRHAVVAVGDGTVHGAQAILVRNSWGPTWGVAGHAWLTQRFLEPRLFATAHLMEDVDVFGSSAAA